MVKQDQTLRVFGLSCRTDNAYMYGAYGEERWCDNIHQLLDAGYSNETTEWIMRSKIARWADDIEISILEYVLSEVGDVRLRMWMRETV